jgi:drug/metabolite transporter (DMT)-like permease
VEVRAPCEIDGHGPSTFRGRAVALALLTGVAIAGYSVVNKVGVTLVPVPLYAMLGFAANVVLLAVVLRVRGELRWPVVPRARWGAAVAVGVLMFAAYLGVLSAMARAPVSYVVAAREVSIVTTVLGGALLLHEPHSRRRIAGAGVIFAGLVAIALSR